MKRSVYLLLLASLFLANRCAPEEGVPAEEGIVFEVKNNSSNAILVLSGNEAKKYKSGSLLPEVIAARYVDSSSTISLFVADDELLSSAKGNQYAVTLVEGLFSKGKRKAVFTEVFFDKESVTEKHYAVSLIYDNSQNVQVFPRKE